LSRRNSTKIRLSSGCADTREGGSRQHRGSVFAPLALTHHDLIAIEVEVLHPAHWVVPTDASTVAHPHRASGQAAAGNGALIKGLSGAPLIVENALAGVIRVSQM
jgi:hypothetical protein